MLYRFSGNVLLYPVANVHVCVPHPIGNRSSMQLQSAMPWELCSYFAAKGLEFIRNHLQECPGARAGKCPTVCFLSVFGPLAQSAQRVLFGVFGPKQRQKPLKKHSLGHSEPEAQKHSKSTPWGTFRPGPLGTPVNGGRDRNT